jgi:HD-GYP domain-containing protein (c-di-GMP phosphodiesterase class II)
MTEYPVHVDQLCVGVYIRLDPKGKPNPFMRKSFKIKTKDQIAKIRAMGLTHVTCVLAKSDTLPTPPQDIRPPSAKARPAGKTVKKTPVSAELLGLKQETIERNKARRAKFAKCEKRYDQTVAQAVTVLRRVSGGAGDAMAGAATIVNALVDTFVSERDVMVNLMSSKPTEAQKNYHALNVTVLSMLIGKDMGVKPEVMHLLGMGALFHDIAKGRMPIQNLERGKATTVNRAVEAHYKHHPKMGADLVNGMDDFPRKSIPVLLQHHEAMDGSGFPDKLVGKQISPLARIVAVADRYDKLCNPEQQSDLITPHEALKIMFAKDRHDFDDRILSAFIRNMGVYPPGTVVKLSNGLTGMVVSTNPKMAARPGVLVYHAEVPKKEAIIVDLSFETELTVKKTMRPEELPRDIFAYLSPTHSVNYYADNAPPGN